jgi:hypothetical protein
MVDLSRYFYQCSAPALCVIAGLLVSACRQNARIPSTPAEVQATLQTAFKDGDPKVRTMASNVVTAIQNQKPAEAFMDLSALSATPGLTEEQRMAAVRSKAAVSRELQVQADRGDKEAARILQLYQMSR